MNTVLPTDTQIPDGHQGWRRLDDAIAILYAAHQDHSLSCDPELLTAVAEYINEDANLTQQVIALFCRRFISTHTPFDGHGLVEAFQCYDWFTTVIADYAIEKAIQKSKDHTYTRS